MAGATRAVFARPFSVFALIFFGSGRFAAVGFQAAHFRADEAAPGLALRAPVLLVEPTGVDSLVQLQLGEHRLHWRCAGWPALQPGQAVTLRLPEAALLVFDAETGERLQHAREPARGRV